MSLRRPKSRPKMSQSDVQQLMNEHGLDPESGLSVIGIRGYYPDSFGKPGVNDRGVYDDALFIVAPDHFSTYNANTDPSGFRKGRGTGSQKGMACLKPGLYRSHQLGLHKGVYLALVQRAAEVTVVRDGSPPYEDTGYFGINIHRGGDKSTSSLGCQTVVPEQWEAFISNVKLLAKRYEQKVIPYLLVEE